MAVGSLTPVLCIAVMEPIAKNMQNGDIGPGTIIGSVAFNILVSIGMSIVAVRNYQVRKVQNVGAFLIMGVCLVAIFIWINVCISSVSYGKVELWETITILIFS